METEIPLDSIFLQRFVNYGPISALIHKMFEFYGSLKKNSTLKIVLKKAEQTLEFLQPYFPDISKSIHKNHYLTILDDFGCRQLDNIEFGVEKTKDLFDKEENVMTNVKNVSSRLAENGKQLVQEKIVKPVGGPVKDFIDTHMEIVADKLKTREVQNKIAPIQEFVVDKAQQVHDQIENNSQFEAIKPHYERALAQVSHVVETLSILSQVEENNTRDSTDETNIEANNESIAKPEEIKPSTTETKDEIITENEEETQIEENEDDESNATNFNYLRYNLTFLKQSL